MNTSQPLSIAEPLTFDPSAFASQALSSPADLAAVLDHTLLKPEATRAQVIRLCHEAAEHRCACAMVNPAWVPVAVETLAGTGIPVGVVIGFPLGASLSASKSDETKRLMKLGAHDIDMVLNIGFLKSGSKEDYEAIRQDIRGVVEVAHGGGGIVKVILETCLLNFEEKLRASEIALAAGADFIKTSTGKEARNAELPVGLTMARCIREYRERTGHEVGLKPAGGIRTAKDSLVWMLMMKEELGTEWLKPALFRFGASSLLGDIERQLEHHLTGRYSAAHRHPMA